MIRKFLFLLFLALILTTATVSAQYDGARDAISIHMNGMNYLQPISEEFNREDFDLGLEFQYVRHLNSFLNLAVPIRIAKADVSLDDNLNRLNSIGLLGADAVLQLKYFKEPAFISPYLFAGIGGQLENLEEFGAQVPLGAGINWRLAKHSYLSTRGEYRVGLDDFRDNVMLSAGLHFILGAGDPEPVPVSDRDGDGIPDGQDMCPDEAGLPALSGCPDRDGDGIADGSDECPDVVGPASMKGCPDTDGDGIADKNDECPNEIGPAANNGCPIRDNDGDGIPNDQDNCPDEAGTAANNGCPIKDADGDGVPDADDECPNAAGVAALKGCPDSDGDGVADKNDKCPDKVGPMTNSGCPVIKEEVITRLNFAAKNIQFETASATIRGASYPLLDEVVQIMNEYPDYSVRVGGHTDSIGAAESNQKLSERRAKAVYDYLISRGISASRLSYAGYGEAQPIADNRYKDGRAQNRRVELDIYLP